MIKYAAHIGNMHAAARVTPFFESYAGCAAHAVENKIEFDFVRPIANWIEHQAWNKAKVGMYAQHQVNE